MLSLSRQLQLLPLFTLVVLRLSVNLTRGRISTRCGRQQPVSAPAAMTIAISTSTRTITIPVGTIAAPCEVPRDDAALVVRYLVMAIAAKRAGRRGVLHIPFPQPYLRQIVSARAAALAAGGAERAGALTQMADQMRAWGSHQALSGPTLDDICSAMTAGQLLDDRGEVRATVERDPYVGELIAALLGHAPDCGVAGCVVCAGARGGRWGDVLALTGTPPEAVRDAYTLALDCGWLPRLPDALPQVRRLVVLGVSPSPEEYIDPFDL